MSITKLMQSPQLRVGDDHTIAQPKFSYKESINRHNTAFEWVYGFDANATQTTRARIRVRLSIHVRVSYALHSHVHMLITELTCVSVKFRVQCDVCDTCDVFA